MGYKQLLERMKAYESKHRPLKEDLTIDGWDDKFVIYYPNVKPHTVNKEKAIKTLQFELDMLKRGSGAELAGRGFAIYCEESVDERTGDSWSGRYKPDEFLDVLNANSGSGINESLTAEDSTASTEPPKDDIDNGVAKTLNDLIVDEWEAVSGYNDAIAMFRLLSEEFPDKDFSEDIKILSDIVAEENIHIGQLQKIMQKFSPNAEQIKVGEKEAEIQAEG